MRSTETFYAIEVKSIFRGRPRFLARPHLLIQNAGPAFYYFRRDAVKGRRGFAKHRARVVKVQVTYTWS